MSAVSWEDDVWKSGSSRIPSVYERANQSLSDDLTSPEENRRRGRQELELCTYVSRVYDDSPAFYCGLTPGDVILSVNDVSVAHADHEVVVKHVREAGDKLRHKISGMTGLEPGASWFRFEHSAATPSTLISLLCRLRGGVIVLFENCIKKVELEVKLLRLKRLLFNKELELRALLMKEKQILKGVTATDRGRASDVISTGSSTTSDRSLHSSADSMEVLDSFTQMSLKDPDHDSLQSSSMSSNQTKLVYLTQYNGEDTSLKRPRYKRHHSTGTHMSRMTSMVDPQNSSRGFPARSTSHHVSSTPPERTDVHSSLVSSQKAVFRRSKSEHTMNIRETRIGYTTRSLGLTSNTRKPLPPSFRKTSLPTSSLTASRTVFQNSPRALDWMNDSKAGGTTAVRGIKDSSTPRHKHFGGSVSTSVTKTSRPRPHAHRYSSMEKLQDFCVDQPSVDSLEMSGHFSVSMVLGLESPSHDEISSL
ncbi:hypothetical protein Bbelb_401420 [Branchiostoma belcheri]|nr:hypothetical protein Bbelb_401420 [Branchiostoma belcheri]